MNLETAFNAQQLAVIVTVLAAVLGGVAVWGIKAAIRSNVEALRGINTRLETFALQFEAFRKDHPTRVEVDSQIRAVNQRVSDTRHLINMTRKRDDDDLGVGA